MRRVMFVASAVGAALALSVTGCGGGGGGDGASPGPPPPNPLYVRVSGNDTNSGGDPDNALRTISKAAQLARTGYRVIVGPGVYPEGVTTASTGIAPQRLQFIADVSGSQTGDRAGDVTLNGSGTRATAGFNLFSSLGSVIDGFTVTGFTDAGIVIKSRSDNFTIQNCVVFDNPGDGIRVQDSPNTLVFNNLVYGNDGTGIGIVGQESGSPDARLIHNTIVGNGTRGIVIGNTRAASPRALVRNNIVQGNRTLLDTGQPIDSNIRVLENPRSDLDYDGNYNLVFPGDTYIPSTIRGANDFNGDARFTADFHLQSDSPAINRGGPLNLPNSQTTILRQRTTTGAALDAGAFDLGFHFIRNR